MRKQDLVPPIPVRFLQSFLTWLYEGDVRSLYSPGAGVAYVCFFTLSLPLFLSVPPPVSLPINISLFLVLSFFFLSRCLSLLLSPSLSGTTEDWPIYTHACFARTHEIKHAASLESSSVVYVAPPSSTSRSLTHKNNTTQKAFSKSTYPLRSKEGLPMKTARLKGF